MTAGLLVDNSAWSRLRHRVLEPERAAEILDAAERGLIHVCLPFLLEAGYSARSADEHTATIAGLMSMPSVAIDERVEANALAAQRGLARSGHHRLTPMDLIIAALADRHDLGILHYDADYDVIRERTDLDFESVWLAPPGTL